MRRRAAGNSILTGRRDSPEVGLCWRRSSSGASGGAAVGILDLFCELDFLVTKLTGPAAAMLIFPEEYSKSQAFVVVVLGNQALGKVLNVDKKLA